MQWNKHHVKEKAVCCSPAFKTSVSKVLRGHTDPGEPLDAQQDLQPVTWDGFPHILGKALPEEMSYQKLGLGETQERERSSTEEQNRKIQLFKKRVLCYSTQVHTFRCPKIPFLKTNRINFPNSQRLSKTGEGKRWKRRRRHK